MKRYRFPGLNAYTKHDRLIFKGRDEDARKLYKKIALYKTIVLHAESGIGKSSLIQAGLIPILEESEDRWCPIIINMSEIVSTNDSELLTNFVRKKILEKNPELSEENKLLPGVDDDSLWMLNKQLEYDDKKLLLIFDQFEHLQSFNAFQINDIVHALFDLQNPKMPSEVYNYIEKKLFAEKDTESEAYAELNKAYISLNHPSTAKMLFVIREDKLGTMSLLSDYFPDILKNDFIIKPLTESAARRALIEPARCEGEFESKPFTFNNRENEDDLVEKLIADIADSETKLVDPIQLQIVASNIEKNLVIGMGKTVLEADDIPKVSDIINDHYATCWYEVRKSLGLSEADIKCFRRFIVPKLLVGDKRDLIASERIKMDEQIAEVVEELTKIGLLREIPVGKNTFFYQLCHDRLIEPIRKELSDFKAEDDAREETIKKEKALEDERIRVQQEQLEADKKRKFASKIRKIVAGFSIVLVTGIVLFLIHTLHTEFKGKENHLLSVAVIRNVGPTFAYKLLKTFQGENANKVSDKFNQRVASLESANYTYLSGVFPYAETVLAVDHDLKKSTITILDNDCVTEWDFKTNTIKNKQVLEKGYYIGKKIVNGEERYLVMNDYVLEVRDANGTKLQQYYSFTDKNVDLSRDGNYIIIDKEVYNTHKPDERIGALPSFPGTNNAPTATIFLNDSKHIAVGYENGYKFVYRINEQHKDKIRVTAVFSPVDSTITCLATDSKSQFLYAGTSNNTIEVWKLDSLEEIDAMYDKIAAEADYIKVVNRRRLASMMYKLLSGHTGGINSIVVAPGDSLLLSASRDNTGILWSCKTWRKRAMHKGEESDISQLGFLGDEKNFYTASAKDGLLYVWSYENAADLFAEGRLARFSPFDYYSVGLAKEDEFEGRVYDTSNTANYFSALLHYIYSMPTSNDFPNDKDYLSDIKRSMTEITNMFNRLTARADFRTGISAANREQLYKSYNTLEFDIHGLIANNEDENVEDRILRMDRYYSGYKNVILVDTSSAKIYIAIQIATKYRQIGSYYTDSMKYEQAMSYFEKATDVLEPFYQKYEGDKRLQDELSKSYGYQSYYYLFVKKYEKAITSARKSLKIDSVNNDWIHTNIAAAYLLDRKFVEAERIYFKYKDKLYPKGVKPFAAAFLEDFSELKKAGIIKPSDAALNAEVEKISQQLKKVKTNKKVL